jgi:hypothetical protein
MKSKGLSLPKSTCTVTEVELPALNYSLLSGERAMQAVKEFLEVLEAPPSADVWMPWLGKAELSFSGCFDLLVTTMADTWRRLYLPFQSLPWIFFKIAFLEYEEAAQYMEELRTEVEDCCRDPACVQAPSSRYPT